MGEKKFTLTKPITVHGANGAEEARSIALREPVMDDLFDFGMPYDDNGNMDFKILRQYLTRLSVKHPDAIGMISPRDMHPMLRWLAEELKPGTGKKLTEALQALVFEWGFNPTETIAMTPKRILFWAEQAHGWNGVKAKMEALAAKAEARQAR